MHGTVAVLEVSAFITGGIRIVVEANPVLALWLAKSEWPLRRPVPLHSMVISTDRTQTPSRVQEEVVNVLWT